MKYFLLYLAWVCLLLQPLCAAPEVHVPDWAKDAVWYQLFPERFRDGDPTNNPTRNSLEWPVEPSTKWRISPWTADWYARDVWETEQDTKASKDPAPAFYRNGVLDRRYGGDLQGVLQKLDYLADLGINTLYFNPVFYARSLHKYDGNSYHHVDPYFGPNPKGDFALMDKETSDPATWQWTSADKLFLDVIKKAHAKGIRVVIDGVFNHTGRDFFAFDNLRRLQVKSPYKDWYMVDSYDDPATTRNEFQYRGWWGHKTLPVFSSTPEKTNMHPGPKAYVFDATRRWMDPNGDGKPDDGIDGWRLDVADERPPEFWADWHKLVRSINPEAYTSAEVWSNPQELILHGKFSACMNYHGFAIPVKGFLVDKNVPPSRFAKLMDERRNALPTPIAQAMQNLIDSHDTDRVASMVVNGEGTVYGDPKQIDYNNNNNAARSATYKIRRPNERERRIQRLVAFFQMTYVGAPMIYYGTEVGMWGGIDPDCRQPMIWADMKYDAQAIDPRGKERTPDEVAFDESLFQFYKSAIAFRRKYPVLSQGDYKTIGTFDTEQTLVFLRKQENRVMIVAINRSDEPHSVECEVPDGVGALLAGIKPLYASQGAATESAMTLTAGRMKLTLPGLTGVVFGKE